jgi:hypothetical protein
MSEATLKDAYWREHKANHLFKRASHHLIAPLIVDGRSTFMVSYLGSIQITNDGRYRWTLKRIKSLPPRGWTNEHKQGTAATLYEAKALVEAGFSKEATSNENSTS